MLCSLGVMAKQMTSDGPYYDFTNYMMEKTYSVLTDCEDSVFSDVTIDAQWLCGLARLDKPTFEILWDAYINTDPIGISLDSLSMWGRIPLSNDSSLKGKFYETNDGYLMVSYGPPPPESSAEGSLKIGYATELYYLELPFYIISGQTAATPETASENTDISLGNSEENGIGLVSEPKVIEGESLNFNDEVIFGDKDAPITIIEYSDYNCPSCAQFHDEILPLLIKNYINTGKVNFVYRDVTLIGRSITESAVNASLCVRKQLSIKDHLNFINDIYLAPRPRNAETIQNLSQDLKVNKGKLNACIQNQKYKSKIQANNRHSLDVAIQGTPTFIMGRQKNGQFEGIKTYLGHFDDFAFVLGELKEKLK